MNDGRPLSGITLTPYLIYGSPLVALYLLLSAGHCHISPGTRLSQWAIPGRCFVDRVFTKCQSYPIIIHLAGLIRSATGIFQMQMRRCIFSD